MPPITKRGDCCGRKILPCFASFEVVEAPLPLDDALAPIFTPIPIAAFMFIVMPASLSTGRGSIRSNPALSMASPSHLERSSLSAISTAEGLRLTTISDERPRRTAQGRMLTTWCSHVDEFEWWSWLCEEGCGWNERLKRWCGDVRLLLVVRDRWRNVEVGDEGGEVVRELGWLEDSLVGRIV